MIELEERVGRLVLEYAQCVPAGTALHARLSLKKDLAIESLSLVALTLRLGDELGVDVVELAPELGNMETMGDLYRMARTLERAKSNQTQ